MKKIQLLVVVICLMGGFSSMAQFGAGISYGGDLYGLWANPVVEGESDSRSVGSAIINSYIGPKIWIGGKKFNVSVEGQINYAPFAFDTRENKGLGALSFPIFGMLNFKGASTMTPFGFGYSIGGGVMYTKTELYAHKGVYDSVTRDFFPTYFGQINLGLGLNGNFNGLYFRYGAGPDKAWNFNVGLITDVNYIYKSRNKSKGKKETENIEKQDKEVI